MLKGFLDKYVLADGEGGDTPAAAPAKAAAAVASQGAAAVVNAPTIGTNNEFVTKLRDAIKSRQTAFTALLTSADKLANVIPDASMRLKAAFEMVKGEGRGLKEVVGAIDVHLADLESQKMQFGAALQRQKQGAIGAMQAELDSLGPASQTAQSQIQALQAQIAALNETIGRNAARAGELQGQIASETMRFTTSEQQFEAALAIVKSELEGQKTVVSSTLA